jgi:tetratricopeptide (TPR) repeat protein
MSIDAWARFRQRLMDHNQRARYLAEWSNIRGLTELPVEQARVRLRAMVDVESMDEGAFQCFRNAMILINAAYMCRSGLEGITDPVEWEKRYHAYLTGGELDAARYNVFLTLRGELENIRKPQDQQPPYSQEELSFGSECDALFGRLAIAMNRAGPGLASRELIIELRALTEEYGQLLQSARPENRARRQAREAIANATYAIARTYLILGEYSKAEQWFVHALNASETLGDRNGAQDSRRQLAALAVTARGDVDGAMQANLKVLTGNRDQRRTLDRAGALVGQLSLCLKAGDTFEAKKLLTAAVEELELQHYLDPVPEGVETRFGQWVEAVPSALCGNEFLRELAMVVQLYAAVFAAKAQLSEDSWASEQTKALSALVRRMAREEFDAEAEFDRLFTLASIRPLAPYGVGA